MKINYKECMKRKCEQCKYYKSCFKKENKECLNLDVIIQNGQLKK
jgi:hypothetical protein